MSLPTPLGVFTRSRRDWAIETMRVGWQQNPLGSDDNLNDNYYLNNNSNDGTILAVWSVLAWQSAPQPLMIWNITHGLAGTSNGHDFQNLPTAPQIPGYTYFNHDTSPLHVQAGSYYLPDGIHPLDFGHVPVCLIPSGWTFVMSTWRIIGAPPFSTPTWFNIVWSPYSTGKLS